MPNSIFSLRLYDKIRSFYRWLHPETPTTIQNGLVSQNFIFFQFLPFSPGTPLNLSWSNIRNGKGVLLVIPLLFMNMESISNFELDYFLWEKNLVPLFI